jgi:hypothetical protein
LFKINMSLIQTIRASPPPENPQHPLGSAPHSLGTSVLNLFAENNTWVARPVLQK